MFSPLSPSRKQISVTPESSDSSLAESADASSEDPSILSSETTSPPKSIKISSSLTFFGFFRTKAGSLREQLLQQCSTDPSFEHLKSKLTATFSMFSEQELLQLKDALDQADPAATSKILITLTVHPIFAKHLLSQAPVLGLETTLRGLSAADSLAIGQMDAACALLAERSSEDTKLRAHLKLVDLPIQQEALDIVRHALSNNSVVNQGLHTIISCLSQDQVALLETCTTPKQLHLALGQFQSAFMAVDFANNKLFNNKLGNAELKNLVRIFFHHPQLLKLAQTCFDNLHLFINDPRARGALFEAKEGQLSKFEKDLALLNGYIAQFGAEHTDLLMHLSTRLENSSRMSSTLRLLRSSPTLLQYSKGHLEESIKLASLTTQIQDRFQNQMPEEDRERLLRILIDNPNITDDLQYHCDCFDGYLLKHNPEQSAITVLELKDRHTDLIKKELSQFQMSLARYAPDLYSQKQEELASLLQQFEMFQDSFPIKDFLRNLNVKELFQNTQLLSDYKTILATLNLEPDAFFVPQASTQEDQAFLGDVYREYRERALLSNTQIIEEALGRYYYSTKMPFDQIPASLSKEDMTALLGGREVVRLARCTPALSGRRNFSLSTQISPTTLEENRIALTLKEPSGASILYQQDLPEGVDLSEFFYGLILGTDELERKGQASAFLIRTIKKWSADAEHSLQQARQDLQHPQQMPAAQSEEEFLTQIQIGRIYVRESSHQLALTPQPPRLDTDFGVIDSEIVRALQDQLDLLTLFQDKPSIQIDLHQSNGQQVTVKLELDTTYREQFSTFYRLSSTLVLNGKELSQVSYLPISSYQNGQLVILPPETVAQKMRSEHFLERHLLSMQAKILKA